MTQIRFGRLIVLACMGLAVACTSGTDGGTTGNTELNLDIVTPGGTLTTDRVDYRISCAGGSATAAPDQYVGSPPDYTPCDVDADCATGALCSTSPDAAAISTLAGLCAIPVAYNDSVDISGSFEIVDTRVPPVWQAVMDLPIGDCIATLSVWDGDEVVCIGSQTLPITSDPTDVTKYDIVLVCSLSVDLEDGTADIDGQFLYITGNLCPKLYVLNAIASTVDDTNRCTVTQLPCSDDASCQPPSPGGIPAQTCQVATEIQYRAKDPDNSCGNNCDPQSCTFDNPPVCTPYPSNINDPACNLAAGGDPNDPLCLSGTYAGLVCTIAALPSALVPGDPGYPFGGTFISPADLITPVGPVLPVNLNLASGIPNIILPGLGGPVTTSSEPTSGAPGDNPLYPGLPNVNGSLPPLRYGCDLSLPGPVLINLTCSDGDAECDQGKQLIISCPGENFCATNPITCDSGNECTADGVCDPFCNPADLPSCSDGQRCDGQGALLPEGTICTVGGSLCDDAGNCSECINSNPTNCVPDGHVPPPVDCQEAPTCNASNQCVPGGASPVGTPCSNGTCSGLGIGAGECIFQAIDPCSGTADPGCDPTVPSTCLPDDPQLCEKVITVSCGNNITADVSILPYLLQVDPSPILASSGFTADFDGVAEFSETFLDAAQGAVPGGVTKASLVDLIASVQERGGGATGPVVPVGGGATIPYECVLGDTGPGAQQPCDLANDEPSVPGVRGNTDCIPIGTFNPCGRIVVIPTSADCAGGGVCAGLGKASQCAANGFCVTGGLPLPLDQVTGVNYTAGDGVSSGQTQVLFGWFDNPAQATQGVGECVGGTADASNCRIGDTCQGGRNNNAPCSADATCETNPGDGDFLCGNSCTDGGGVCGVPTDPDGTWNMKQPVYTGLAQQVGLAVNAGGLAVQLECVMGVDAGGPDGPTPPVPDDGSPTPDGNLISFTVQVP